jgi:hypothetical protein
MAFTVTSRILCLINIILLWVSEDGGLESSINFGVICGTLDILVVVLNKLEGMPLNL